MVALSLFRVREGGGPIYKSEVDISQLLRKLSRILSLYSTWSKGVIWSYSYRML